MQQLATANGTKCTTGVTVFKGLCNKTKQNKKKKKNRPFLWRTDGSLISTKRLRLKQRAASSRLVNQSCGLCRGHRLAVVESRADIGINIPTPPSRRTRRTESIPTFYCACAAGGRRSARLLYSTTAQLGSRQIPIPAPAAT